MEVNKQFHKNFKLKGVGFSSIEEIIEFSKSVSEEIESFLINWFDDTLFVEVQTSGSTGMPKIFQLQKNKMVNSAIATGRFFNLLEKSTALLCMSPNYIAGKMMLVRAITLGWDLDIIEPVVNPLKQNKKVYDFCAMVPLQLYNSIHNIHNIKKLIVGGGVVSKELLDEIQNSKTEIFATYGMTETITHIAVKKLNNFAEVIESKKNQSQYQLLPDIRISKDKRNCLVIEAPKIASEKIITNDLVKLVSDTEFEWLGRYDTIINSGGIKLIPEQIEERLEVILKSRFFVAGIPDVVLGEKLVLIIEGAKNTEIFKKIKLLKTLSKFEIPKKIYFVEKFIETDTQKVNRIETLKLC